MSEEVDLDQLESQDHTATDYVVVDPAGVIQHHGRIPRFMIDMQPLADGHSIVIGAGTNGTHYLTDGTITERPANTTTLSGMKLLNVPNPSSVTIAGEGPHEVTDGEVDLEFTQPGTYEIKVSSWPMLDAVFEVTQS